MDDASNRTKPGPKPIPEEQKMVMVAGRVPRAIKAKVKEARAKRRWNESQFVRYAVEQALKRERAA